MVIFSSYMKNIIFLALFLSLIGSSARANEVVVIDADFWVSPRYGESVVAYEPLAQLLRRLIAEPQARLLLERPAGEWGELWGQELRAWLISLGLSGDRIDFGESGGERVRLSLLLPGAGEEAGEPLAGPDPAAQPDGLEEVAGERPDQGVSSNTVVQDETVVQEQE